MLLEEGLGGLCLFGSNTADGPDAVAAYTANVRSVSPGAVIAVDEEGGDVTRLHVPDGSPVLGPLALGAADDLALTRAVGRAIGLELAAVGITLDLGPVADVNSNADNPVIGTRSFGPRRPWPRPTWPRGPGLQSAGVAACAKHFPGHGDTAEDSHLALPVLNVDMSTLAARELVPFVAAIEAGTAAVMTSHVVVPALDPELPATLSAPILGLLRDRLGFRGVIVSDALDMAGASAARGIPEAAVLSIAAGADLLCIGADNSVEQVRSIQAALVDAVRAGRLTEERLAEAANAVCAPGRFVCAATCRSRRGAADESAAGRGRGAVGDRHGCAAPLAGARVVRVDSAGTIAIGAAPWGLPADERRRTGVDRPPGRPAGGPGAGRAPAARRAGHARRCRPRHGRGGVGLARPSYRRPADDPRAGLVTARRGGRDRRAQKGRVGPVSRPLQAIGLDIGATKTLGVLVDAEGQVLEQVRGGRPSRARTAWSRTAELVVAHLGAANDGRPTSVGLGIPGLVDVERGAVKHAVNLGVDGQWVPLRAELEARLGVPVAVENDVNVATLGAVRAERDPRPGLPLDRHRPGRRAGARRHPARGATGAAGEIGHVPIDPIGAVCQCGQRGCLETVASGRALAEAWPSADEHRRRRRCSRRPPRETRGRSRSATASQRAWPTPYAPSA